jgi:hypothetical protein
MGDQVFHAAGTFRVAMPVGKAHITAERGFECWPETGDVDLKAG